MSIFRVIGEDNYIRIGTRKGWSKDRGRYTVITYKGPPDKVDSFYASLVNNDAVDEIQEDTRDGDSILDVTYIDDDGAGAGHSSEEENAVWEVVPQDIYKDIRAFDGIGAAAGRLQFNLDADQANLEEVREAIERADKNFAVPAADPEKTYFKLLSRGAREFVRSGMILRKSISVGPRTEVRGDWKGVDKAWKQDGEEGSPNLVQAGEDDVIGTLADHPDYNVEKKQWLKRGPYLRKEGRRRDLVYEWWFAKLWSNAFYAGDNADGNP